MSGDAEVWRSIPSVPGVIASSHGRVMLVPYRGPANLGGIRPFGGTPTFGQWDGLKLVAHIGDTTYKVARLVCEAFNGPPSPEKPSCLHVDENCRNNRPGNLVWGTQKENMNAPGFVKYCKGRTGDRHPANVARRRRQQNEAAE